MRNYFLLAHKYQTDACTVRIQRSKCNKDKLSIGADQLTNKERDWQSCKQLYRQKNGQTDNKEKKCKLTQNNYQIYKDGIFEKYLKWK